MDWAGRVLVPSRIERDECRGNDLNRAEHDEHADVDGDSARCDQKGSQQAERIFTEQSRPARARGSPGLAQLAAACEAYLDYLQRRVFPGGCFFAATALEMGTRPGPVKERVAAIYAGYTALLRTFAATALEQHELPAREDPDRLAFELHAILLAADAKFVLNDDPAVLDLARQVIRRRLGLDHGGEG